VIYQFDDCALDVERRELRRSSVLVSVEPQVFNLLIFLIKNRERVVTRDEVFQAVWHGRIVSESVLSTRINAARNAIGDSGAEQRLIRTLRRQGLRFVGTARESGDMAPSREMRQITMLPPRHPLSIDGAPEIVIYPFRNLTGEPRAQCVVDGLTEEITIAFARLGWFKVIARNRTSLVPIGPEQIARGPRYELKGSLRQADGKARATVQIVDALSEYQIWASRYDSDLEDVFAIQDEITSNVIQAVADRLYAAELTRGMPKTQESRTVWQSIVHAISLINTRRKLQVAAAESLLLKAVSIEPTSVPALSLLSFIATLRVHLGWRSRADTVPAAWRIAERATSLNPEHSWAHLALGYAAIYRRPEEAVRSLEHALKLDSQFTTAHYLLALASNYAGDHESAFRHADMADGPKCYDLLAYGNPAAADNVRATICFMAGRHRDGIAFARKALEQSPRQTPAYRQLAMNCAFAGETHAATAALAAVKRLSPNLKQWISESSSLWSRQEDYQKYVEAFRVAGLR
jgi:TolB-like protein